MPLDVTHSAFLVIRTVFFALLTYIHVLILIFASWNIAAAKSSGMSAPGASVFLLMSSVFIFVLVPIAYLAELICAKARPAHVRFECVWTALMSIFQLAASIGVTIDGSSMYCQTQLPWTMCASSSLLVHITWLATLTILSYCLTICVAASTHAVYLPDIWITPVPRVPWFRPDIEAPPPVPVNGSYLPDHKHKSSSSSWSGASCALSKYIAERWDKLSHAERQSVPSRPILFAKGRQSMDPRQPTWARQHSVRRGVEDPFAKPLPKRKDPPVLLAPPPRTHSKKVVLSEDSHVVEVCERPPCSYVSPTPRRPTLFPRAADNPDLPVPRPRVSEWVRAELPEIQLPTKF